MKIKGIQLIPATIKSNKGEIYEGFYCIHVYHEIEAMDKDKEMSDYRMGSSGVFFIESFRLDEKVLKKIPLEERLVFKLKESGTKLIYHCSVVDAIMDSKPEGVKFIKVEKWSW